MYPSLFDWSVQYPTFHDQKKHCPFNIFSTCLTIVFSTFFQHFSVFFTKIFSTFPQHFQLFQQNIFNLFNIVFSTFFNVILYSTFLIIIFSTIFQHFSICFQHVFPRCKDGYIGTYCELDNPCREDFEHCLNGGTCRVMESLSGVYANCTCRLG